MSTTAETVQIKTKELFTLLTPHRSSDVMQRINLFCLAETGKKLPDFFNSKDEADTDEKKVAIADRLIAIVKGGTWQLLPAVPSGQAGGATKPTTPPAAKPPASVKPASNQPVTQPTASVDTPATQAQAEAAAVKEIKSTLDAIPVYTTPKNEAAEQDPATQLAALIGKLANKPTNPSLTRDDIRLIVREEIALIFQLAAGALTKK